MLLLLLSSENKYEKASFETDTDCLCLRNNLSGKSKSFPHYHRSVRTTSGWSSYSFADAMERYVVYQGWLASYKEQG